MGEGPFVSQVVPLKLPPAPEFANSYRQWINMERRLDLVLVLGAKETSCPQHRGFFSPHLFRPGKLQIALIFTGSFALWHCSHSPTASDVMAQHCRSSAKSPCCGHASPV